MAIVIQKGSEFKLEWVVRTPIGGGAFSQVNTPLAETILTNDASLSTGIIETSDKGSNRFREYLPMGGLRSLDFSVSGFFSETTTRAEVNIVNEFIQAAYSGKLVKLILVGKLRNRGSFWDGNFIIENFEQTGGVDSAHEFSCTIKSSGTFTYTYRRPSS